MKTRPYLFAMLLLALATACSEATQVDSSQNPGERRCLTDSMAHLITLDTVKMAPVQKELKLNGRITFNEEQVVRVTPLVTGNVVDVRVELGDYVQRGQVLCVVRSADIVDLTERLEEAKANAKAAEKSLQTVKEMQASRLASDREVQLAQSELDRALADLRRVEETMRIYGASGSSDQVMRASSNGYIVQKNITTGTQVRASDPDPLFIISELNEVWVMASVFEQDISSMKVGYPVEVSTLSYPDAPLVGHIDKVYNVLDPGTQTMKVRVRLPNPSLKLKPEMFASVLVRYPGDGMLPEVDARSIIFDNNRQYVVVMRGRCDYEARPVTVSSANTRYAYISDGLKPGETVVSRYQLLVYDSLTD